MYIIGSGHGYFGYVKFVILLMLEDLVFWYCEYEIGSNWWWNYVPIGQCLVL